MSPTTSRLLDLELAEGNSAGVRTIRAYLHKLLSSLIVDEADFSGKRPFGHGAWMHEMYVPMIRANLIHGTLDENGFVDHVDVQAAKNLLLSAVFEVFAAGAKETGE